MSTPDATPPPLPQAVQEWEYQTQVIAPQGMVMTHAVELREVDAALAAFGQQGWELASSFVHTYLNQAAYRVVLIFKRPRRS